MKGLTTIRNSTGIAVTSSISTLHRVQNGATENHVKKDELTLIYSPGPGNRVYMGLQTAAEGGPHELLCSVPGADLWPSGLEVGMP